MSPFTLLSSRKRCPKGSRRNKKTGKCQHIVRKSYTHTRSMKPFYGIHNNTQIVSKSPSSAKCPRGTRLHKISGKCVNKPYRAMSKFAKNFLDIYKYKQK